MNKFSKGLHQQIEQKAKNGNLRLSELKPNSRAVAERMIAEGFLVLSPCKKGYIWHAMDSKK